LGEFRYTTAIKKIRKMKARKKVIQGSTSAGKTYGIIPILIDKATKTPKLRITIVAETIPAVKDGAVSIFKDVMQDTGRWIEGNMIMNPIQYKFTNGSIIQFRSFDSVGKAKAAGKRDILFINECNHVAYNIADTLIIRSKECYFDFNPDNEFWAHTEILTESNSEFLSLTYLDNEGLPKETLEDLINKRAKAYFDVEGSYTDPANIKNAYWANWWKVYGLGETGNLQGVIFNNWKQIEELPKEAKLLGYGMDFGYNDPTTLIAAYKLNNKFIFDEVIFQSELTIPQIDKLMQDRKVERTARIYADEASPMMIKELKDERWKVLAAEKGKGSIMFGLEKLQQEEEFYVTSRSIRLIEELRKYSWATDRAGERLDSPIDNWNHGIDAIRYFMTSQNKSSGRYSYGSV